MAEQQPIGLTWKGYEGQDYEEFWAGPGKRYLDAIERLIAAHALPGGDSIVEIGAGFGRMGQCYVAKYARSHMVEPASNLRAIAQRTYGERTVQYHDASAYDLPFPDNAFDAALMVRVFHHFAEPGAALREIARVLKPRGLLVFNYSNKRNLKRMVMHALGRGPSPYSGAMESYYSTLIGHHPRHVDALLAEAGFEVDDVYATGIADKIVNAVPSLAALLRPSLALSRLIGRLEIAPAQFVVARKR